MSKSKNKKILILTGPGGSGKSTIAEILVKKYNFLLIDGDREDTEFFPDGEHWKKENLENLKKAHDKIFNLAKELHNNQNKNIVIDYIIFGDYINFFEKFKKEFARNLIIKVLFPSLEEMIKRDWDRECWTTGVDRIISVRKEFEDLKKYIGKKNYINSSNLTAEKTINKYFKNNL